MKYSKTVILHTGFMIMTVVEGQGKINGCDIKKGINGKLYKIDKGIVVG